MRALITLQFCHIFLFFVVKFQMKWLGTYVLLRSRSRIREGTPSQKRRAFLAAWLLLCCLLFLLLLFLNLFLPYTFISPSGALLHWLHSVHVSSVFPSDLLLLISSYLHPIRGNYCSTSTRCLIFGSVWCSLDASSPKALPAPPGPAAFELLIWMRRDKSHYEQPWLNRH